jgi:hypothetical protein
VSKREEGEARCAEKLGSRGGRIVDRRESGQWLKVWWAPLPHESYGSPPSGTVIAVFPPCGGPLEAPACLGPPAAFVLRCLWSAWSSSTVPGLSVSCLRSTWSGSSFCSAGGPWASEGEEGRVMAIGGHEGMGVRIHCEDDRTDQGQGEQRRAKVQ